ncbi:hypothetical protein BC829DRAFT_294904 [Chytridium lagenaria]|nr:hypothetical protein BC829DRAFT_294904 [Chytridium lagenaria]
MLSTSLISAKNKTKPKIGAASGAIVGAVLGAVYTTAQFSMPTWVPLAWAFVQGVIVLIASYSEIGLNAL